MLAASVGTASQRSSRSSQFGWSELRSGSANLFSDNIQSANAARSDCVALNVSGAAETVTSITIWYYGVSPNPHVLVQTTGAQTVAP
jgi:hypothetical protein